MLGFGSIGELVVGDAPTPPYPSPLVQPTEDQALTILRSFLISVLPLGVVVIRGQDNRVPEPLVDDFVVMTPIRRRRLRTNVDAVADCRFTGSVAGSVMTVTDVQIGELLLGATVFGVGVLDNTRVTNLGTGGGGVGIYAVSNDQIVPARVLSTGTKTLVQGTELVVQIDVHGTNGSDNAQTISTAFRDEYATSFFGLVNPAIAPLHADDPKQVPFINDQKQYEDRWAIDASIQINPTVTVPQQFADEAKVIPIDVLATYRS